VATDVQVVSYPESRAAREGKAEGRNPKAEIEKGSEFWPPMAQMPQTFQPQSRDERMALQNHATGAGGVMAPAQLGASPPAHRNAGISRLQGTVQEA
jgi:hypothetical protein